MKTSGRSLKTSFCNNGNCIPDHKALFTLRAERGPFRVSPMTLTSFESGQGMEGPQRHLGVPSPRDGQLKRGLSLALSSFHCYSAAQASIVLNVMLIISTNWPW